MAVSAITVNVAAEFAVHGVDAVELRARHRPAREMSRALRRAASSVSSR